jgi:hypothetical protein
MANGLYGKASPLAGVWAKITDTAVPNGKVRTVNVAACNSSGISASIWIAYSSALADADIEAADMKASGRSIKANAEHERTNQVLAAGEHVWVKASIDGVAFDVRGFEGKE